MLQIDCQVPLTEVTASTDNLISENIHDEFYSKEQSKENYRFWQSPFYSFLIHRCCLTFKYLWSRHTFRVDEIKIFLPVEEKVRQLTLVFYNAVDKKNVCYQKVFVLFKKCEVLNLNCFKTKCR